jgi:hypothetical protein
MQDVLKEESTSSSSRNRSNKTSLIQIAKITQFLKIKLPIIIEK